jgi:hypothetical protein
MVRKRTEAQYEFQISDFRFESGDSPEECRGPRDAGATKSAKDERFNLSRERVGYQSSTVGHHEVAAFSASLIGVTGLIRET